MLILFSLQYCTFCFDLCTHVPGLVKLLIFLSAVFHTKCIYVYKSKIHYIIFIILLYIMLAYLMLFNALFSAVCLYDACLLLLIFLPLVFTLLLLNSVFCFLTLSLGY